MSIRPLQSVTFYPTIAAAFLAVEDYRARLTAAGVVVEPELDLAPIDGLLVRLLTTFPPDKPILVDAAAAATQGATTALCATTPGIRRALTGRSSAAWRPVLARLLADRRADREQNAELDVAELVETPDTSPSPADVGEPETPVLVLLPVTLGDRLVDEIDRWLDALPRAMVLTLGIGQSGTCPAIADLIRAYTASDRRLALARELTPAFASSQMAVVGLWANALVAPSLTRAAQAFTDHFRFLDLVRDSCLASIRQAALDEKARVQAAVVPPPAPSEPPPPPPPEKPRGILGIRGLIRRTKAALRRRLETR